MASFSDVEIRELRRVLASFKSTLPSHELGGWYITSQPVKTVIVNDAGVWNAQPMYDGYVRLRGYASCIRCGQEFAIPDIGNFTVHPDRIGAGIEAAKEWVTRDAERGGLCWGDVPQASTDGRERGAVMDGVAAMREP